MADYSTMSDSDLMAAVNPSQPAKTDYSQLSDADLMEHISQNGASLSGMAKSFGTAAVRSTMDMMSKLGSSAVPGVETGYGDPFQEMQPSPVSPGSIPSGQQLTQAVEKNITGPLHEPQGAGERIAAGAGSGVPYMAIPGAGGLAARAFGALAPGAGSQAAGELVSGPMKPYAELAGGLAMPSAFGSMSKLITPFETSPSRLRSAGVLQGEGIQPTAGQITGSDFLMRMERQLGGTTKFNTADEDFTSAALGKGGIQHTPGTDLSEELNSGFDANSAKYQSLTKGNPYIILDSSAAKQANDTLKNYVSKVEGGGPAPIVETYAKRISDAATQNDRANPLTGEEYQNLRSEIGRDARGVTNNPNLQHSLYGLQSALDDAAERSIAISNPADLGKWQDARNQYRNLLVLQNAAGKSGQAVAEGTITPANLKSSADQIYGKQSYARGEGPFTPLSKAGYILQAPKSSGTAENMAALNLHAGIPAIAGGFSGLGLHLAGAGPEFSIPGAFVGAALPHLAGKALMSNPMQSYLSNQLLSQFKPQIAGANRSAVINALLQAGQRTQ